MTHPSRPLARPLARRLLLGGAALAAAAPRRAQAAPVQIEYWQYTFKERITAMDELIARFQAANPDVAVRHVNFPYAQYRTKVSAAVPAGEGPDVLQLYYGWLRDFRRAKLLQKLPAELFPPAAIDAEFFPFVQQMRDSEAYYALPTAVRSMGMFTNRKLLADSGQDAAKPPATLDEFVASAKAIIKRDGAGNLLTAGTTIGLPSQDYHWWREVLVRQFGGTPFSPDNRRVAYDSDAGAAALGWYAGLQLAQHVAEAGFMTESLPAFRAGRVGLHVDGSFSVGVLQGTRGLDWGVAELPTHQGIHANYASYWVNALVAGRAGARRDAALRFLRFLTTPESMALWLEKTGELPARPEAAHAPGVLADPVLGPFARGLDGAVATVFADEDAQRAVFTAMLDRVLLKGQSPREAVREAAPMEQKILDAAFAG